MPKPDGTFRRIHNLSSPKPRRGLSVNAAIPEAYSTLTYSNVDEILALILFAGRGAIILKRDLKDAFRNISRSLLPTNAYWVSSGRRQYTPNAASPLV